MGTPLDVLTRQTATIVNTRLLYRRHILSLCYDYCHFGVIFRVVLGLFRRR
jgi:hypothetical protein